jgi:hypothetical protein
LTLAPARAGCSGGKPGDARCAITERSVTASRRDLATRGVLVYLALTFGLSWTAAAFCGRMFTGLDVPAPQRLLAATLVYAACMGWQPLFAVWFVRRFVDQNQALASHFRPVSRGFLAASIVLPLALAAIAMLLSRALDGFDAAPASGTGAIRDTALLSSELALTLGLAAWLAGVVSARRDLGGSGMRPSCCSRPGGSHRSLLTSLGFVLSCCLLGTSLGWLRLATDSLVPTTIANSLLTIVAGLPLILQGDDPGLRSAAYGPAGWLPMLLCILALAASRLRGCVRLQHHRGQRGGDQLARSGARERRPSGSEASLNDR